MRSAVLLTVVATALLVYSAGPRAQARAAETVPDGLSASDWSSIRAAYDANRHAAFPVDGGYQARNPGQEWRTCFDGRGFTTMPDASEWSWGLELVSYGVEGADREVVAPTCADASGQRIVYEWDDNLTEWYINDQRGLEHGYTVHRRPRPEGARSLPEASASGTSLPLFSPARRADEFGRLQLNLAVRGNLRPQVSRDARGVTFINANGAPVVTYTGLTAFDATGAILPAWFDDARLPQASSLKPQALRIVIDDSNAIYPLTIDPVAQQAYLKASNTGTNDNFGFSVAASGDTVVVGANLEDSNATGVNGNQANNSANESGAAYVFVRSGGVWTQEAYLKASDTFATDQFGYSVAVSGDTVVVGAPQENSDATGVNGDQTNSGAGDSGAAYVFIRVGGVWSQQAYLKASNTGAGDVFGESVALSGDTVVVGAFLEDSSATGVDGNQADNSATDSGAAYVFVRSGGVWSQEAYLKASNTEASDWFSDSSVAVSGDTVVVGAKQEDSGATGVNGNQADNSQIFSGAAYVFVRSGGVWSQQAYLKASNTEDFDSFGWSVAASGDTVVVGALQESSSATGVNGNQADNSAGLAGAAYVFVRTGGIWSQQAYLKASNTGASDNFGGSVAASGDTVVVGAYREDSNATGVDGNQANNSAADSGAAYVFTRFGGVWSQQAYLKASNTGASDLFGYSVAVSADTVVVGAYQEDSNATGVNGNQADNSASNAGAAYVFTGAGPPPDTDGDGVPDASDACPNNAPGLPICTNGRPLRDCNNDCLVDGADIQCIADEMLNQ